MSFDHALEDLLSVLPKSWRTALSQARIERVDSGLSAASVFRVGSLYYLKVAQQGAADDLRQEIERTAWLKQHGIHVASVVRVHDTDDFIAVLNQALEGSRADETDLPPDIFVETIGRALSALHAVSTTDCPFDESIAVRLNRARALVDRGEIDPQEFAPRNRLSSPYALIERLRRSMPSETLVVVHGDATLSNMVIGSDLSVAFIDCGHAGRADPYVDLALVAGGLAERFGATIVDRFMKAYGGTVLDREKTRYFLDLYELF